ncbi:MAG: glycosyltransferase family 1 protein [Senegalia sp. (in: firmicutes)]|uniref:glycosyltransferase family 1 protein n=1 Tax=Senegalia sp. (in: firmicutes) TaxID=1924098 RepID=UPI003F969F3D
MKLTNSVKVLIISTVKFDYNGITNNILNYYNAMNKDNITIDFIFLNNPTEDFKEKVKRNGGKIFILSNRNKNPILYMFKLYKIMRTERYNIVHAHGNSSTLAIEMYISKKTNVQVRIPHAHSTSCKYKGAHKILRPIFDRSYTHAFACGNEAGKWLFKNKPFVIIKNGINLNKFSFNKVNRKEYKQKMGLINNKVVGHIGHFSDGKNHDFLIDVFYELHKIDDSYKLLLIGDGVLRKEIEEKVKKLNISQSVIFAGKRTDIPELMSVLDVFVMPSLFEGFPLTLVESQAACLPCFVSDGVSKEVGLTNLVRFISLDNSPKEWASRILKYEAIDREKDKYIIHNKINEEGYDIIENSKKMKNLYEIYFKSNKG